MKPEIQELARLIMGMRKEYAQGNNAMAWARKNSLQQGNTILSTLVAYDLQAGDYVERARNNPEYVREWCGQIADLIRPYMEPGDHVLEVGVGEATTLAGVINAVNCKNIHPFGFDISWSRIRFAQDWAAENHVEVNLFVGDLFRIPLADNSIDVVYTSHSLEPNGGKEEMAIAELLRVARKAVVLVEPLYELAGHEAKIRMAEHGYVRNLKSTAEKLGAQVSKYGLLDFCSNPLNPSGVLIMHKPVISSRADLVQWAAWQCPVTGMAMTNHGSFYYAEDAGIAYPVLCGVPLLRAEHGVIASKMFK